MTIMFPLLPPKHRYTVCSDSFLWTPELTFQAVWATVTRLLDQIRRSSSHLHVQAGNIPTGCRGQDVPEVIQARWAGDGLMGSPDSLVSGVNWNLPVVNGWGVNQSFRVWSSLIVTLCSTVSADWDFCLKCGKRRHDNTEEEKNPEEKPKQTLGFEPTSSNTRDGDVNLNSMRTLLSYSVTQSTGSTREESTKEIMYSFDPNMVQRLFLLFVLDPR